MPAKTRRKNLTVFRTGAGYKFVDSWNRRVAAPDLTIEYCIKAEPGEPRQSYRVLFAGRPALMKVRQLPELRGRVRAALGCAYLRREQRCLQAAIARQLPVVGCLGHGWKRARGLVTEQILLLEWLDDYGVLRDEVRECHGRGDRNKVRRELLPIMTDLFLAVRMSGIADKDFGAHNILIRSRQGPTRQYRWIDLERCVLASVDDADSTAEMTGSALASWWIATGGSIEETVFAWEQLRARILNHGRMGDQVVAKIDHEMREKIAKLVARQWIQTAPPADLLYTRAA